jgi:hypothetical protein
MDYHPDGFIQKVYLKEYVPGQPNQLDVPIEVTYITNNPYIMNGDQVKIGAETLSMICYNE